MFFKPTGQTQGYSHLLRISIFFALALGHLVMGANVQQRETVDRILALVNGELITLTDVRIAKAFGLYEKEGAVKIDGTIDEVLQKLIDQKLVIQVTSESTSVNQEEMDALLDRISKEMGNGQFQEQLDRFGMQRNDLRPYVFERMLYRKIISSRFDRAVLVTLNEIQDYYEKRYVPAQESRGLEVKSMFDILDEIETILRGEKSEKQIREWLQNLREKADIQINLDRNE